MDKKTKFRGGVYKVFDSLNPLLSSSSSPDISLWFLPNDGVEVEVEEKREFWKPPKDRVDNGDEIPFSLSFDDYFDDKNWKVQQETNSKNAQEDLWNRVEEEQIELDSSLHNEEEDEYDRMAQGLTVAFQETRLDEEANEDNEKSLLDGIIKDNFQVNKSNSEGKPDADDAAAESKTISNDEDQCLKSILKRKTNANNHGGIEPAKQVRSFDDLACNNRDFHTGASKEWRKKHRGNAVAVKPSKHVRFDLATAKKHQMLTTPNLNPKSLSALAQLARLIAEVQQGKEGSSSTMV